MSATAKATQQEQQPCRGPGCGRLTYGITAECPDGSVSEFDLGANAALIENKRFWVCPECLDEIR